ncbi:MAG: outer membrane beta-barrel protein [Myxococcota bacterium]
MRDLVLQLQDQVQTQQEQINVQQDVLQDAGLENERGSASMMSSFLSSTDFSGHVATSYIYNANEPASAGAGENTGGGLANLFHGEDQSFQLDEVWMTVDRAATAESGAGFHFEVVYGATAGAQADGGLVWIPEANISYATPWGPTVTAGKIGTTIGIEKANSTQNANITRGLTYSLQPRSHTGFTVSGDMGGISYTLGAVNGVGTADPDGNNAKGFLWGLGMGDDSTSLSFNGIYSDKNAAGNSAYLLDLVAEHNVSDSLSVSANLDYNSYASGNDDPWGIALSIGSRLAISDDLGVGGRFELLHTDADDVADTETDTYSVTVTSDYALADNLTWKCEVSYLTADDTTPFSDGATAASSDDVWLLGTQLTYSF